MEIKNGKRTNIPYIWSVYCHKSLVHNPLESFGHKKESQLSKKLIAYAKKKNIPLATAILSGYIDELNKHPELCLSSSDDEIFGPARKRGKKPTARQLAEEDLVCKFRVSVHGTSVFLSNSYQGENRNFYSIDDLKDFKELGEVPVDPELNLCLRGYRKVEFEHHGDHTNFYRQTVREDNPFIGSKDGPFCLNDRVFFGGNEESPLNEGYLSGFSKFDWANSRWEENFFAWRTLFGRIKVARHLPRRLCRKIRKTGMLDTQLHKCVQYCNYLIAE